MSMQYLPFAALAAGGGTPPAGLATFIGARDTGSGAPSGQPLSKRNEWAAYLSVTGAMDFEDKTVGNTLRGMTGSSNGTTITLDISGTFSTEYFTVSNNTSLGRYNTTPSGSKWGDIGFFDDNNDGIPWVISFSSPVNAVGFYATDAGDFSTGVSFTVTMNRHGGGTDGPYTICAPGTANAALHFFGIYEGNTPGGAYDSMTLLGDAADAIGIDDIICATYAQLNPA